MTKPGRRKTPFCAERHGARRSFRLVSAMATGGVLVACNRPPMDASPHSSDFNPTSAESRNARDSEQAVSGRGQAQKAASPELEGQSPLAYLFEPAISTLEGTLDREERYGPPNYGETPDQDLRLTVHVLRLVEPITVGTADSTSEVNDAPVHGVVEVQVVFSKPNPARALRAGAQVGVRGRLAKQLLARDFYPVILRDAELVDFEELQ